MKRHPALVHLSHDHRHLLFMCQQMKINGPEYETFPKDLPGKISYVAGQVNRLLLPHMEKEESGLFRFIHGFDPEIDTLVAVLTNEHHFIRQKFNQVVAGHSAELMEDTGRMLETHIRKEERILFELIQKRIPDTVLLNLETGGYGSE